MEIEEARERIKQLEGYIELIESYSPKTMEEKALKLYVLRENVNKVAQELNQEGYRIDKRKVAGKDISDIIRLKSEDELHLMARKIFMKNKKRSVLSW